jgi:hypothetical protein
VAEVLVGGWSLVMRLVEKRSAARRGDSVARNERMFSATCICVEILVAALAIYALGRQFCCKPPPPALRRAKPRQGSPPSVLKDTPPSSCKFSVASPTQARKEI